jgi:hypothetical protein
LAMSSSPSTIVGIDRSRSIKVRISIFRAHLCMLECSVASYQCWPSTSAVSEIIATISGDHLDTGTPRQVCPTLLRRNHLLIPLREPYLSGAVAHRRRWRHSPASQ